MAKKFYLFRNFAPDYSPGIAGAIATSKKEAIEIIVNQYTADFKQLQKLCNYQTKLKKEYPDKDGNEIIALVRDKYPDNYNSAVYKLFDDELSEEHYSYYIPKLIKNLKASHIEVYDLDAPMAFYIEGGS